MTSSNGGPRGAAAWRERVIFAHLEEPPFCFRAANNRASGCDVELSQVILRGLGVKNFQPIEVEFADLIPGLVDGRWTMTTGLFVTAERRRRVEFSQPIWALHDGLLVRAGNPRGIAGYSSVAADPGSTLAVIKDQAQHDSALKFGVPPERIVQFRTQKEAADAVADGLVDAYASVATAHRGYLALHSGAPLAVVDVSSSEQAPAFGAFSFAKSNGGLAGEVNHALQLYLGSEAHRELMTGYGFCKAEVDRVVFRDSAN